MSEHAINPDLFEQLPLAASVRRTFRKPLTTCPTLTLCTVYTADRRDSEVIHASDLCVHDVHARLA